MQIDIHKKNMSETNIHIHNIRQILIFNSKSFYFSFIIHISVCSHFQDLIFSSTCHSRAIGRPINCKHLISMSRQLFSQLFCLQILDFECRVLAALHNHFKELMIISKIKQLLNVVISIYKSISLITLLYVGSFISMF